MLAVDRIVVSGCQQTCLQSHPSPSDWTHMWPVTTGTHWDHEVLHPGPSPGLHPRPQPTVHSKTTRLVQGLRVSGEDQGVVQGQGVQWVLPRADRQLCQGGEMWHFQVGQHRTKYFISQDNRRTMQFITCSDVCRCNFVIHLILKQCPL